MSLCTDLIADCHIPCHVQCIDSLSQNCGLPEELSSYIKANEQKQADQKQPGDELSDSKAKESSTPQEQETAPPPPKRPKKGGRVVLLAPSQPAGLGPAAVCERVPVLSEKASSDKKAGKRSDATKLAKVTPISGVEESDGLSRDGAPASSKVRGEVTLHHRSPRVSRGSGSAKSGDVEERTTPGSEAKHVKSIYEGFEFSKVIKMEQTSQPR